MSIKLEAYINRCYTKPTYLALHVCMHVYSQLAVTNVAGVRARD